MPSTHRLRASQHSASPQLGEVQKDVGLKENRAPVAVGERREQSPWWLCHRAQGLSSQQSAAVQSEPPASQRLAPTLTSFAPHRPASKPLQD